MSIFTGALINNEHTLRDWGAAITNSDVISLPEPNLTVVEVPGRNGRLDLSEALTGDITYGNREIKLILASPVTVETWHEKCQHIFNAYHGKTVTVIFDEDPTFHYKGRATITSPERVRNGGTFTITIDAEPFKFRNLQSMQFYSLSSINTSLPIEFENEGRAPVCPELNSSKAATLVVGNITYTLQKGNQTIPSLILMPGVTAATLEMTGGGNLTASWTEGLL